MREEGDILSNQSGQGLDPDTDILFLFYRSRVVRRQ